MEITLSQLQAERNEWVKKNFPDDELEDSIMGAVEEIGELAHHYLKRKQDIRGDQAHHYSEMLDAVADCVIFLAGCASHLGVDYGELVTQTWETVKRRDWQKDRREGVGAD
jgi:NTP pyrophosphatase (non-canonical NTP hydrolase)